MNFFIIRFFVDAKFRRLIRVPKKYTDKIKNSKNSNLRQGRGGRRKVGKTHKGSLKLKMQECVLSHAYLLKVFALLQAIM